MKKKVSLKDIAQAAGVSTALVSYVLNNKEKEARVGKEIAAVIRDIAKKLDYQPNLIAKSLKSGRSHTIGLIVADISNQFFANIARTIEDEAKKNNYTVIFGSSDENPEKSWDLISVLINRQVDGFIIAPTENSERQIEYLNTQNIPFVLIDRYFPGISSSYVATDNYQASYQAVLHLIETGHDKIGMIAYRNNLVHIKERKRGYTQALADNNLLSKVSLIKEVSFNNITEDIEKNIKELLSAKRPVNALFFATNTLALHGLKLINKLNYKIPDDLAVVCFDEGDAFDFFYSPLTFVDQPIIEVGKEAVRILIDQVTNKNNSPRQIFISSKLVIRKSSGA
jgi:LacI family transcriptional regulator